MGQLVAIIGNTGVGKSTLARQLQAAGPFALGIESHADRPFQALFSTDLHRYALPNQVDYLLFRAEQEEALRKGVAVGVIDGGLDQDFFVFTRLFYQKGYLAGREYQLCERLYALLRRVLPPPELVVWLVAPLPVVEARFARRKRSLEIAGLADLRTIEVLVTEMAGAIDPARLIQIDASADDPPFSKAVPSLLARIQSSLKESG
jgi:deoxyadenosine/deoxycytidine kinase